MRTPDGGLVQETGDHAGAIVDLAWRPGGDDLAVVGYGGPHPLATRRLA